MKNFFISLILVIPFIFYAIYSYARTDPNLVITQYPLYWNFQQKMWELGYHKMDVSSFLYATIVLIMFASFLLAIKKLSAEVKLSLFFSIIVLMIFAHNALSHDIFNYMFNAKMVVKYQQNPHVKVALDFPSDDWIRFMHNTHTPAPYGYGWTALSLIPYSFGFGTFNLTYYAFKLFMIAGLVGLFFILEQMQKLVKFREYPMQKWLFFLNPLVLVETVGNVHNDVWMLLLYFIGFWLAFVANTTKKKERSVLLRILSLAFFAFSVSIKFATAALLPIYGLILLYPLFSKSLRALVQAHWADLSALLMMLPLLSSRSQQFHPWYLMWSLIFIPFVKNSSLRLLLVCFSVFSLLRYVPFLQIGEYTPGVLMNERLITWVGSFVLFLVLTVFLKLQREKST